MKAQARVRIGRRSGVGAGVRIGRRSGIGIGARIGKRKIGAGVRVSV